MSNNGQLFIVATPIGNLQDITLRALETFKSVDFILCEDTRVSQKILARYDIKKELVSYHQHSTGKKIKEILARLASGESAALITDAGTPGISDPGNPLVAEAVKQGIGIVAIPGASAVTASLSISGFPTDKFLFFGFPPNKNKRKKYFNYIAESDLTVAFYESCHRINKTLKELSEVLTEKRQLVICRELTKKFEEIIRGSIKDIIKKDIKNKGEFIIIVAPK